MKYGNEFHTNFLVNHTITYPSSVNYQNHEVILVAESLLWKSQKMFELSLVASLEVHAMALQIFDMGEFGTSKR